MKSPWGFIVEPFGGKLYKNESKDGSFLVSSNMEDHKATNREALIKSLPLGYVGPIKESAIVVVHHNVFRKYFDMAGKEQFSSDRIGENLYVVDTENVFAYKNDWSQDWEAVPGFCFVSPIDEDDSFQAPGEKTLYGVMNYPDDYLKSKDIAPGDKVCFTPDSEYEFNLDGKKMYRVFSRDICLVERQKK